MASDERDDDGPPEALTIEDLLRHLDQQPQDKQEEDRGDGEDQPSTAE